MTEKKKAEFLSKLDKAVTRATGGFEGSLFHKLLLVLRYPKKMLQRKIVLGWYGQKRHVVLKAKTFFGSRMYVNNYDLYLWFFGITLSSAEIRLTRYLIQNIVSKPNEVFFDIGAHHGFYTLLVHALENGQISVHSFEPTPLHFSLLQKNAGTLKHVYLNNEAVYSASGPIDFFENVKTVSTIDPSFVTTQDDSNLQFKKISVSATSLDDYCRRTGAKPTFLKIDVEGAEKDVILGAQWVLDTYHPDIALEVWREHNANHQEAFDLLIKKGYTPFLITEKGDLTLFPIGKLADIVHDQFDNLILKKL